MRGASASGLAPSCLQSLGYAGVPAVGRARVAEVGEGIIFLAFWEFTGFSLNALEILGIVVMEQSSITGATVFTVVYCCMCQPQ